MYVYWYVRSFVRLFTEMLNAKIWTYMHYTRTLYTSEVYTSKVEEEIDKHTHIRTYIHTRMHAFMHSYIHKYIHKYMVVVRLEISTPRYKIIVQVTLGEMKDQGVRSTSRCLWDPSTDNYASSSFKNVRTYVRM